jgi:hypothetical protein
MRLFLSRSYRLALAGAIAFLVWTVTVTPLSSSDEDVTPRIGAPIENPLRTGAAAVPRHGGMRVYLDEDGRPTVPPAASSHVFVAPQVSRPAAPEIAPLTEIDAPGGGKMVILDGRFQPYSTARITADGTVLVECKRSAEGLHTRADGRQTHLSGHLNEPDHDGLEGEQSHGSPPPMCSGTNGAVHDPGSPASPTIEELH